MEIHIFALLVMIEYEIKRGEIKLDLFNSIVEIAGTFKISMDTSTKVYDAVMAGADMWAVISIIAAVTGPLAIGGAVVFYMIKRKIKGMSRSAAIAW